MLFDDLQSTLNTHVELMCFGIYGKQWDVICVVHLKLKL